MSTISAGTTTTSALVNSGDTTGTLVLQTNGTTTALTLSASQTATFAGAVSAPSLSLTTTPLSTANGGTGSTSTTYCNLGTNVTGILPTANGGTNSQFFTVTGPASSAKTYTFPNENMSVGYRNIPAVGTQTGSYTMVADNVGKYIQVGSGGSVTIPAATFAEGDAVLIANNTTGNITITCSAVTTYIAGANTTKTSLTLATRGFANLFFLSNSVCIVSGNVT